MMAVVRCEDAPIFGDTLDYDADPTAGTSASRINEDPSSSEEYSEKITEPPSPPPKYDEVPISFDYSEKIVDPHAPPPKYEEVPISFVDADPTAGRSAPRINEEQLSSEDYSEKIVDPHTPPPKYDEVPISFVDVDPTAGPSVPRINEEQSSSEGLAPTTPEVDESILQNNSPSPVFREIYEACIRCVKARCCYSVRFVNRMKPTDINSGCAFYYSLESYCEKRESVCHYTPYKGGPIDGPENGQAPDPWEMHVPLMKTFVDSKTQMPIPHTDSVETCSWCSGNEKVSCSSCGIGRTSCLCNGLGHDSDCTKGSSCYGNGKRKCSNCCGTGKETCSKCNGYGKIKSYKVLYVTWTNHLTEFMSNIRQLPAEKIKKASGDTLVSEENEQVTSIDNAPDDSVNAACASLLEAHRNSFTTEIIRRQRHSLRVYPFTVVRYQYKDEGEIYIYGKEKEVYIENNPRDCYCCCICC